MQTMELIETCQTELEVIFL